MGGKSPAGGANAGTYVLGQPSPSSPNRPTRKRSSVRKTSCLYTKTPTPFAQGASPTNADVIASLKEGQSAPNSINQLAAIAAPVSSTTGTNGVHPVTPTATGLIPGIPAGGTGENPGNGGNDGTTGSGGNPLSISNPQEGTATGNGNIPHQYDSSIHPINAPYQYTHSMHTLTNPNSTLSQHILSTHPINTPSNTHIHTLNTLYQCTL